jgi:UDP-GlcNAc:undecaprenyl-phosphate GlcNAc-1-phosphate transferase
MAAVFALVGQPIMAGAVLVLAGPLAGFLPFNLHPARLFLGDSGATCDRILSRRLRA